MTYEFSYLALIVFLCFVGAVLALSFWLGSRAKTAGGYFAAHGQVGWFVNGIAFAGDYLSAASFLGICGMIAFSGYDGFLYSIGYLAGWVVALFVIAEPIKRLGKYTFADALDAQFNSRSIKLAAAISTLVVSIFYLIPQMVGAGALIKPLLGLDYKWGVLIVGTVVIVIVTTAGMVSTTWVQFIKGSLLVVFCTILVVLVLHRGVPTISKPASVVAESLQPYDRIAFFDAEARHVFHDRELLGDGDTGARPVLSSRPLGPVAFLEAISSTAVAQTVSKEIADSGKWTGHMESRFDRDNQNVSNTLVRPSELLPGGSPTFKGVRSEKLFDKLDFISLMIALFAGTASLPHILIRYYTVKDAAAARKSTVVGIASIGFFYVLTLYIGLGAMVCGNLDPTNSNMAAPLLARSFGELPFALISAIAFTTVLGTVSGLILAATGAVAHDLVHNVMNFNLTDTGKVAVAKVATVVIGIIAMVLGIFFEKLNVTFLVGWAFNVAASANLPALVMLLFWKRTTKQGIAVAIFVGLFASLGWLLLSAPAYQFLYGYSAADAATKAIAPFSQPGLVTIPLGFAVLVIVSLMTNRSTRVRGFEVSIMR